MWDRNLDYYSFIILEFQDLKDNWNIIINMDDNNNSIDHDNIIINIHRS
jgi:hypothetical protein